MAYSSRTLAQLRTDARALSEYDGSDVFSDATVSGLINQQIRRLHGYIAQQPGAFHVIGAVGTISGAGVSSIVLPSATERVLQVRRSSGDTRAFQLLQNEERGGKQAATDTWSLSVDYLTNPTALSADGDTAAYPLGWDTYVTYRTAAALLAIKQMDVRWLQNESDLALNQVLAAVPGVHVAETRVLPNPYHARRVPGASSVDIWYRVVNQTVYLFRD